MANRRPSTETKVKRLIHAVEAMGKEVRAVREHYNGDITLIMDKDAVRISGADAASITPEELRKLI